MNAQLLKADNLANSVVLRIRLTHDYDQTAEFAYAKMRTEMKEFICR